MILAFRDSAKGEGYGSNSSVSANPHEPRVDLNTEENAYAKRLHMRDESSQSESDSESDKSFQSAGDKLSMSK